MTLFLSCATVAFEIRERQIWQLMTKPVHRINYLLGKWVGVATLNVIPNRVRQRFVTTLE